MDIFYNIFDFFLISFEKVFYCDIKVKKKKILHGLDILKVFYVLNLINYATFCYKLVFYEKYYTFISFINLLLNL
jgi:hypothetical protein